MDHEGEGSLERETRETPLECAGQVARKDGELRGTEVKRIFTASVGSSGVGEAEGKSEEQKAVGSKRRAMDRRRRYGLASGVRDEG